MLVTELSGKLLDCEMQKSALEFWEQANPKVVEKAQTNRPTVGMSSWDRNEEIVDYIEAQNGRLLVKSWRVLGRIK